MTIVGAWNMDQAGEGNGTSSPIDLEEAYWKFNESTGATSLTDSSGNGHTATPIGGTFSATTGKLNNAMNCTVRGASVPDHADLRVPSAGSPISISVWVYWLGTGGWQHLINKMGVSWNQGYGISCNNNTLLKFWVNAYNTAGAEFAVPTGGWHHIVGVYDGSVCRMYVDNVLQSTGTSVTSYYYAGNNMGLGSDNTGSYQFNGYLDDARVYPGIALDAAAIDDLWNSGAGHEDPLQLPRILEGWKDESAGENHGNLVGAPTLSDGPISKKRRTLSGTGLYGTNRIEIPHDADFKIDADWSIEMWLTLLSTPIAYSYVLSKGSASGPQLSFYIPTSNLKFVPVIVSSSGNYLWITPADNNVAITVGRLEYVVVTFDYSAKHFRVYIKGGLSNLVTTEVGTYAGGDSPDDIKLGCAYHNFYPANIDIHAMCWRKNEIMTPKEIHDNYNGSNIIEAPWL